MKDGKYLTKITTPLRSLHIIFEFKQRNGEWQGFVEPAEVDEEPLRFARTPLSNLVIADGRVSFSFEFVTPIQAELVVDAMIGEDGFAGLATTSAAQFTLEVSASRLG